MSVAFTPRGGEYHDVGGDYYDAFALDDERWLVTVGDVCGKGAEAAAVTSLCRYSIRALSLRHDDPAGLLGELNHVLLRHCADGRFATAALARLHRHADMVRADRHPQTAGMPSLRGRGPRACVRRPPARGRARGRVRTGIFLVDSLADRWGTARHGRACIWFERDLR